MARAPSYDFERRERAKAKAAKRADKAKSKAEKKAAGAPQENQEPQVLDETEVAIASDKRETE